MNYKIKKLNTLEEMSDSLPLIKELTPNVNTEDYKQMLNEMIPHNYFQVGVYEAEKMVAVSGYWICTKIYCGKYLEIDNFVVDKEYRSKNIGKMLVDWMLDEAKKQSCKTVLLDAYVENFKAHKFYYREGFIARGFHYLKRL
ncbi:MAG TPA: GNAT family N-acetyltransferase [Bacteroidia bacterium]|jgi:GNAT superfamily N-acetyltransferase|nr:GNAT family N-acetyltransferase [Bacteroidia bacterium]